MRKRRITAAELIAQLKADPVHVQMRAAQEAAREEEGKLLQAAEKPLVEELNRAGLNISSVWDLVNALSGLSQSPEVVGILLKHLNCSYPPKIREGIARSLADREASSIWKELVRAYVAEPNLSGVKDALALAVSVAAPSNVLEQLIELVGEQKLGSSRVFLVSTIARQRDPRAFEALSRLKDDPEIGKEIAIQLAAPR